MTNSSQSPLEKIKELSTSYWKSQALFTAIRLRLFKEIGSREVTIADLSQRLKANPDGLERFLLALVALGLLQKTDQGYSITKEYRPYLTPESGRDLTPSIAHMDHLQENWLRLEESVRTGKPVAFDSEIPEPEIKKRTERFMAAMESVASPAAGELVRQYPLHGNEIILDLGCGPGTFFRKFIQTYPGVRAWAVDTDDVIPITRRHVKEEGFLERVTFLSGDFRELKFKKEFFHTVLLSNVMHIYSPEEALKICEQAYTALRPGGAFLVNEFFTDETGTEPPWSALFSLNMLLNTQGGRNYRLKEGKDLLHKAGFCNLHTKKISADSTLLIGEKPG